jgi:long-chain acyl-CoA synthetase
MPTLAEPETVSDADLKTLADLPFHVMGRFPKPVSIGRCRGDQIEEFSSKQLFERIRDLSLGIVALGIKPGDRVAIMAESRPEWIMCDLAIFAAGGVTVPIYPTLSPAQVRYILLDSGARIAVVSTRLQLGKLQEVRHLLPALEAVVVMDPAAAEGAPSSGSGASVTTIEELERRGHAQMTAEWGAGRDFREAARRVKPDDLATIIYTSGTTGEPKGVMLTHANLIANLQATAVVLDVTQDDVALSFLPLSHGFERMVSFVYLFTGVTIIFAESFDTLARDMAREFSRLARRPPE